MATIYVNGLPHRITKLGKTVHGYTDVFLSRASQADNASCHKLPADWLSADNCKRVVFTGGNTYSKVTPRRLVWVSQGKQVCVSVAYNGFWFAIDGKALSVNEIREALQGCPDIESVIQSCYMSAKDIATNNGFTDIAELADKNIRKERK